MSINTSTQIYLNTSMLQDLTSTLIDGYFNNRVFRASNDDALTGRLQETNRRQNTDDIKTSPIPFGSRPPSLNNPYSIRGPKLDPTLAKDIAGMNLNLTFDEAFLNYDEIFKFFESRNSRFSEVTTTHNYSLFAFNNIIIDILTKLHLVKRIPSNFPIVNNNIIPGDYIDFCGNININTISNYIDNLINILNNYNTTFLDKTFDNTDIGSLTYTNILNLLSSIQIDLSKGNTTDIIANANNLSISLPLIKTYLNTNGYIYACNDSPCRIFGKVSKVALNSNESINLLSKTGLTTYYSKLITSFIPYLNVLNNNGYIVPTEYIYVLSSPTLQVIPLSICI